MELKQVLLIEDRAAIRQNVLEEFEAKGLKVIQVEDYTDLDQKLATLPDFQMVILDWLLDGESELDALLCLTKLRKTRFVPVVIWTEEIGKFRDAEAEVKSRFPEVCFRGFSKSEVNHQQLLEELSRWYLQPSAQLAEHFRQSVTTAVEQTLYTLAEQSIDDLAKGLKTLISLGESEEIDMEHATDVMLRMLGRQLYGNAAFTDELKKIVASLTTSNPQPSKKERQRASEMEALYMYYKPADNIVRNGDIVSIKWDATTEELAIVLTPACDLAKRDKTSFLRLCLLKQQSKRAGGVPTDRWPLLFERQEYEVCFHEMVILKNKTTSDQSVMRYTHNYAPLIGADVTLGRHSRLDEPYRADLLHHFVSHAGRIGRPDFTG